VRAMEVVERLRQVSPGAANLLMSAALPRIIPSASGLGIRVEEVNEVRARLSVPLKRRTRNHVGGLYFGVQMTVAELAAGLLLLRRFPPGEYRSLVKRVEADFRAQGKGTVYAVCEPPEETFATLAQALRQPGDKAEAWLPVTLRSEDGTVITEVRFLDSVKKR
jgi:acyl-coenzyme A thioesterase PaaI-like protein